MHMSRVYVCRALRTEALRCVLSMSPSCLTGEADLGIPEDAGQFALADLR